MIGTWAQVKAGLLLSTWSWPGYAWERAVAFKLQARCLRPVKEPGLDLAGFIQQKHILKC